MLVACVLLSAIPLKGQTVGSPEPLQLMVDLARFRGGDDEHVYVEVYYGFAHNALTYKSDSIGTSGALDITIVIYQGDSLVAGDRWLVPHRHDDSTAGDESMSLVGHFTSQLRGANYVLKVLGRDRHDPTRRDSIIMDLPIRPYPGTTQVISDIEFASVIRPGKQGGQFYKNTLEVIPNVSGLYGPGQPCYYYAEAYNLSPDDKPGTYTVRTTVFDAVGREVASRVRAKRNTGESSVLVDQLAVDTVRTGTYTLVLALVDTGGRTLSTSGKKFFVYNPALGVDSTLLTSASGLPIPIYLSMGEPELDREFDWLRYEAGPEERDSYERLEGADAKRRFLSDFWRKRPAGVREEYLARVHYVNAAFALGSKEGYRTDRGRVYITYGPPDDIDRHPSEVDSRPYEIWSFNAIQGGVTFVFVQRTPGGDHELVHSTHRNELHDENWDRQGITR